MPDRQPVGRNLATGTRGSPIVERVDGGRQNARLDPAHEIIRYADSRELTPLKVSRNIISLMRIQSDHAVAKRQRRCQAR